MINAVALHLNSLRPDKNDLEADSATQILGTVFYLHIYVPCATRSFKNQTNTTKKGWQSWLHSRTWHAMHPYASPTLLGLPVTHCHSLESGLHFKMASWKFSGAQRNWLVCSTRNASHSNFNPSFSEERAVSAQKQDDHTQELKSSLMGRCWRCRKTQIPSLRFLFQLRSVNGPLKIGSLMISFKGPSTAYYLLKQYSWLYLSLPFRIKNHS